MQNMLSHKKPERIKMQQYSVYTYGQDQTSGARLTYGRMHDVLRSFDGENFSFYLHSQSFTGVRSIINKYAWPAVLILTQQNCCIDLHTDAYASNFSQSPSSVSTP